MRILRHAGINGHDNERRDFKNGSIRSRFFIFIVVEDVNGSV